MCFVSQLSLSAGLRKLESELGIPLIRRGARYWCGRTACSLSTPHSPSPA
ncbi:hypothetical protein [Streptomyces sp. NPDC002790]